MSFIIARTVYKSNKNRQENKNSTYHEFKKNYEKERLEAIRTSRPVITAKQTKTYPQNNVTTRNGYSDSDDGFLTSMLVAQATDSTLMGTIIGGNPVGAIIGDSLNNSDDNTTKHHNSIDDYSSNNNSYHNDHSDYSSSDSSSYDSGSSYDSSSDYSSSDSSSSSDW